MVFAPGTVTFLTMELPKITAGKKVEEIRPLPRCTGFGEPFRDRRDNLSLLLPVQASDRWRSPARSRAGTEGCRLRNRRSWHWGRRHSYPQWQRCRKIRLQDGKTICCLYLLRASRWESRLLCERLVSLAYTACDMRPSLIVLLLLLCSFDSTSRWGSSRQHRPVG